MRQASSQIAGATLVALVAVTGLGSAQIDPRNPSAKEIAAAMRTPNGGGTGLAIAILRRVIGTRSLAELDEIADSVMAAAVFVPGLQEEAVLRRSAALTALVRAGADTDEPGTPYAGAAERLLHLAKTNDSGGALYGLTRLRDKEQAVRLVVEVATIDKFIATAAVGHLARSMGPAGLAALRELFRRRAVVHPSAQQELANVAEYYGWTRETSPPWS